MTKQEINTELNKKFTHSELILFAQNELLLNDLKGLNSKKKLVAYIENNVSSKKLSRNLRPTPFQIWWKRHDRHVYGVIGFLSLLLTILSITAHKVDNEVVISGKIMSGDRPVEGADVSLFQLNKIPVKTGVLGNFNFDPIPISRFPNDNLQIKIISKFINKIFSLPISEIDDFDNLILDIKEDEAILFDPSKFSILILPFQLLQDCQFVDSGIEKTIENRLNDLALKEGLKLEASTLMTAKGCSDGVKYVNEIGKELEANMVIYGDLFESCHSDSIKSRLRYVIVNTRIKNIDKSGESVVSEHKLESIANGDMQLDVDYVMYHSLALESSSRKDHTAAIKYCNKIINDLKKYSPSIFVTRGYSYYKLKDTLSAENDFIRAIEIDSTRGGAYMNLAMLYENAGKTELSRLNFKRAIEFEPENPQIHSNFGAFLRKIKEYEQAEFEIRKSLEIDSNHIDGLVGMGILYSMVKNEHKSARKYYKKVLTIDPYYKKAQIIRHNIGLDYYREGVLDSAEVYLKYNLEYSPDFGGSYFTLGQVYLDKGKIDSAQQLYLKSCEIFPDWRQPRFDSLFQLIPKNDQSL